MAAQQEGTAEIDAAVSEEKANKDLETKIEDLTETGASKVVAAGAEGKDKGAAAQASLDVEIKTLRKTGLEDIAFIKSAATEKRLAAKTAAKDKAMAAMKDAEAASVDLSTATIGGKTFSLNGMPEGILKENAGPPGIVSEFGAFKKLSGKTTKPVAKGETEIRI